MERLTTQQTATTDGSQLTLLVTQVPWYDKLLTAATFVAGIVIVLFNLLTIVAVIKYKISLKTATNIFIVNLSVCDFFCGISYLGKSFQQLMTYLGYEDLHAVVVISWMSGFMTFMISIMSVHITVLFGIDRIFALATPLRYKSLMSPRNAVLWLASVWLYVGLCIFLPSVVEYSKLDIEIRRNVLLDQSRILPEKLEMYVINPLGWMTYTTLGILYAAIYILHKKTSSKVAPNPAKAEIRSRRLTRMAASIVSVVILCYAPITIIAPMPAPDPRESPRVFQMYLIAVKISFLMLSIPPFVNNIFYAMHQKDYRQAYVNLLWHKPKSTVAHSADTGTTKD